MLLIAACARSAPQKAAAGELKAATAAEKAGQYAQAAEHYRKLLKMEPASANPAALAEVRVRMATDQFMAHRFKDSLEALRPVFELPHASTDTAVSAQARAVAGLDDLQLNRLGAAIQNLRQALRLDPASGTDRLALGDALARSGHLDEAVEQYRDQARRTPRVVEAWYKLGVAESQLAKETFRSFTAQHPTDQAAEMLDAERSLNRGDGLAAAKILLPMHGDNQGPPSGAKAGQAPGPDIVLPGVHADMGQAFLEEGYTRAAEKEFQKELARDPESTPAWFGLAETESLTSNWNSALSRLRHLMLFHATGLARRLQLEPPAPLRIAWQRGSLRPPATLAQTAEGRLWKSWIQGNGVSGVRIESTQPDSCPELPVREASTPGLWLTQGCYARLIRKLNGLPGQKKHLTIAEMTKLAEADFRLGRYDDAQADAGRLLRSDPQSGWGVCWLIQSEEALSFQSLLRASALNPNSARVHEMLARNDADHYQWKQAIQEYQTALRLAPNLTDLYFGLGTAYWQAGDWLRAEPALLKTLEISPASTVAAYELGDTYVNERQWAKAASYLRRSMSNPQVERNARLDLSKAESELGKTQQALADLGPVVHNDPDGEIHFRLASLYRKMGDLEKARLALAESEKLRQASDAMTVERTKETERERAKIGQAAKQESH